MAEMISYKKIIERLRRVVPARHFNIFMEKSSFIPGCEQLKFEDTNVQRVVDKINNENVDFVFVSVKTYFNQSVLAQKLRKKGFRCISVSLVAQQHSNRDEAFDDIFQLSLLEMINVCWLTETTIFSQGWLFRHSVNVILDVFKFGNKHFVDFMDFNQFLFPTDDGTDLSVIKKCWGQDALENNQMQHWCEGYLLRQCDRVYFPGSSTHVKMLGLDVSEIGSRFFVNHPILQEMFVTGHNSNGLVFAGGVPPFDNRRVPEIFGDAQLVTTFLKFLREDFQRKLSVYNNPYIVPKKDYKNCYGPHFELMESYPGYQFLFGLEGIKLRRRLATYEFGLMIYDFHGNIIGKNHFKNIVPTKFYLYLESGLPILISEEFEAACSLVSEHKIGVVVSQSDLPNLEGILNNVDPTELKKNVLVLRENLLEKSLEELP